MTTFLPWGGAPRQTARALRGRRGRGRRSRLRYAHTRLLSSAHSVIQRSASQTAESSPVLLEPTWWAAVDVVAVVMVAR